MTVFEKVVRLLEDQGAEYRTVNHEPTFTSEESARARGESLEIGGKAIIMKLDSAFAVFVLSASLKIDSRKIKQTLSAKKTRFASAEELFELTGLQPGSVPPFGRPLFDLDLYADESVCRNAKIAFNAGSLTDSVIMSTADYLRIARPAIISFAETVSA